MADEFKLPSQVVEYLGIENTEELDADKFKSFFDEKFVRADKIAERKDLIAPIFGKKVGEIETKLKTTARDVLGLDLKDKFDKEAKVEDVIQTIFDSAKQVQEGKIKELEERVSTPNDEAFTKLQTDFDKYKTDAQKKLEDEIALREDAVQKFNDLETSTNEKFKTIKLDALTQDAHSKIDWARETEGFDLKYKGFQAHMNENFKRSLNDDGEFIVTDNKGERIMNEKKAGEYKNYVSILQEEAQKHGLLKVNSNGGKPLNNGFTGTANKSGEDTEVQRKINTSTRG